ncbi:hypothetical protein GB937_004103 [Aspergillus fischeri]|nr:hypothetical protein GB937_004103 [Aspergillus fischeri]
MASVLTRGRTIVGRYRVTFNHGSLPLLLKQRPFKNYITKSDSDLFNYTSGRWIYNETLRLLERQLFFNVAQLNRIASASIGRPEQDVTCFRKLAEGGYSRAFEITMRDGTQVVARLPYPSTEPRILTESYMRIKRSTLITTLEISGIIYKLLAIYLQRKSASSVGRFSATLIYSPTIYWFQILLNWYWQHCSILPILLQARPPKYFQNYGDAVSEDLIKPQLPLDFDQLGESEQEAARINFQQRQLHYYYFAATAKFNDVHSCTEDEVVLKQQLFQHAGDPWEGDSVPLKADLIRAVQNWESLCAVTDSTCPLHYSPEEIDKCLRLEEEQRLADDDMEKPRNCLGVSGDGWVPTERYSEAKKMSEKFKEDAILLADSEEVVAQIQRHWPFGDHDEDETNDQGQTTRLSLKVVPEIGLPMMRNRRPQRAPEERRSFLPALELLSMNSPASGPAAAPLCSPLFGFFTGLIITGIAAPLAGNLIYIGLKSGGVGKRDAEAFVDGLEDLEKRQSWPGVPDYNIQMCRNANVGRTVTVRETSVNSLRVENVAPECMVLATLFTEQGTPIPCGSACLDYVNLSAADKQKLMDIVHNLL